MSVTLLPGDCRAVLATLPAASVQMVCTSPPYYGLRRYLGDGDPNAHLEIGTEQTPDAYVAEMVAVFREVRRVLRDDGCLWLNLGSSYASGGKRPSQSPAPLRAPAYDSDGIEPPGSQATGSAYPDLRGECLGGSQSHRASIDCTGPQQPQSPQHGATKDRDSEPLDSVGLPPFAPGVRQSTNLSSSANVPVSDGPEATSSACRSSLPTYARGVRGSARKAGRIADTSRQSETSAVRKQDKGLSSRACDCNSCGICWAYLAIPSLRFKATDLISTPHLVALALQADGWFLRSSIIWAKPNPMPESVTSRPTSAHEHVFLLSKRASYFYDAEAVAEPAESFGRQHTTGTQPPKVRALQEAGTHGKGGDLSVNYERASRNLRNVWSIATSPTPFAHFATMPPDLAERCIKAGTSERGQCPHCAAPWARVVERTAAIPARTGDWKATDQAHRNDIARKGGFYDASATTTGWQPTCACPEHKPVPQTVLDPFAGAGTTLLVADRLGRNGVGIELNPDYARLARDRIYDDCPMFSRLAEAAD